MEGYYDDLADWSSIPEHMRGSVRLYIMHGIPPGSFLTALLSNDFMGAMGKADDENAAAMQGWARFIYNSTPSGSHGSPEDVQAWIARGGFNSRPKAAT